MHAPRAILKIPIIINDYKPHSRDAIPPVVPPAPALLLINSRSWTNEATDQKLWEIVNVTLEVTPTDG